MAVTVMECTWAVEGCCDDEVIESHVPVVAFVDLHPDDALTVPVGWRCHSLTGTAVIATTVLQPFALHKPFDVAHKCPCRSTPACRPVPVLRLKIHHRVEE